LGTSLISYAFSNCFLTWTFSAGDLFVPSRNLANWAMLVVIKFIYLLPTYLYFMQYIEDRCLLLTSSMSFDDLPVQEHRMMEKHHIDQNPYISSLCPKPRVVSDNMTWQKARDQPTQGGAGQPHSLAGWLLMFHMQLRKRMELSM
jgi:hypothetical protein